MNEDLERAKEVKAVYIAGKLSDSNTVKYIENVIDLIKHFENE